MADGHEIDPLETVVTPVSTDASRLELRAVHFAAPIDVDAVRNLYRRREC